MLLEKKVTEHDEKIDFFIKTSLAPVEGIFYDGQIFDAFHFVSDLIHSAKQSKAKPFALNHRLEALRNHKTLLTKMLKSCLGSMEDAYLCRGRLNWTVT